MQKRSEYVEGAEERLVFVRPSSLPGTELMAAYESSRHWHVFHERYAFCFCRSAAAGVRYRGIEDQVVDGSVAVREPGESLCNTFVAKPAQFKMLYVNAALVDRVARELGLSGHLHFAPRVITDDADLFAKLGQLCDSIEGGRGALEQQSLFAATMLAFIRHAERRGDPSALNNGKQVVERAKAYLREHWSQAVSLGELAAACDVSHFHLVHAFTEEAGLSPHAYHLHVRVERARTLLERGVSPAAAAASLGFADQSHLTRHFKRIMHVTPRRYASLS